MNAHTEIDIHSEFDVADIKVCNDVNDILTRYYPGHFWMVGCNHKAGTVHIELPYQTRIQTRFPYGYLLHITSLSNPDVMKKKVMIAGGEMLERYGLPRGAANDYTAIDARKHGLDKSGVIK